MSHRCHHLFIIAVGMLLVWSRTASADITEFTSSSAYAGTSTPYAAISFDALAPGSATVAESSPLSIGGITFTGAAATLSAVPPAVTSIPGDGTPFLQVDATTPTPGNSSYLQITYPAFNSATPVTATGFEISSGSSAPLNLSVDVFLAEGSQEEFNYSAPSASTGLSYLGFEASSPISSITVLLPDSSSILDLDNLTFGVELPEPRPFLLLLAAAVGAVVYWTVHQRVVAVRFRQP